MTLAVLGAGQLGLMIARAAAKLGATAKFLDPVASSCAQSEGDLIVADYTDHQALARLAAGATAATFEFENIPASSIEHLATLVPTSPSAQAIAASQDRIAEKNLLESAAIPVAEWRRVDSLADLSSAIEQLGAPCILKARRGGYDGKSQSRINSPAQAEAEWNALDHRPSICERMIPFSRELSVIAVRAQSGETLFYPTNESHHTRAILTKTISPAPNTDPQQIADLQSRIANHLDRANYIGVFTLECFDTGDALIANETAPRVHNTGHWTIEGTTASQFENHARAVLDLPLAPIELAHPCSAMINIIGIEPDAALAEVPGATVHMYAKAPKPGRKIGHCTITADSYDQLDQRIKQAESIYKPLLLTDPV